MKGLQKKYPFIGDVRGKGLLTAFELVSNIETMDPHYPETLMPF